MNQTVGWYGQGSMKVNLYGTMTEQDLNKHFNPDITSMDRVNEFRKDGNIPFHLLSDTTKAEIIDNIYNKGEMKQNIGPVNYDFNVDVIVRESGSENNKKVNFTELSKSVKDIIFEEITFRGQTDNQIWTPFEPILESEVQTLDEKLNMAENSVSKDSNVKDKTIER